MEEVKITPILDQIKVAMDGRTQRWLALNARIPETDLSRKLNGLVKFDETEIKSIEEALGTTFTKE